MAILTDALGVPRHLVERTRIDIKFSNTYPHSNPAPGIVWFRELPKMIFVATSPISYKSQSNWSPRTKWLFGLSISILHTGWCNLLTDLVDLRWSSPSFGSGTWPSYMGITHFRDVIILRMRRTTVLEPLWSGRFERSNRAKALPSTHLLESSFGRGDLYMHLCRVP